MDCSQLGSSVYGIFQARILEWVAISFSRRSSQLRDRTRIFCISCTGRQILFHWATSSSHRTIIDHSYVECGLNCFICFNSAYSHSKPLKQTLLLIPFLRWGKWGLECCLVQGYRVIRRQSQRCKRTSTNARQAVAETAGYTCVECTAGWEGRSHLVKYPGRLQGRGGGSMRLGKVRGISSGGDQGLEKEGTHWRETPTGVNIQAGSCLLQLRMCPSAQDWSFVLYGVMVPNRDHLVQKSGFLLKCLSICLSVLCLSCCTWDLWS